MTFNPEPYYTGPVEYLEPTYGAPYSIKEHCPKCGNTDLEVIQEGSMNDYKTLYHCPECGKKFFLPQFRRNADDLIFVELNKGKRFKLSGRHIMDEDREYSYDEIQRAMFDAAMDDDPAYHEKAGEFYGPYYYGEDPDGEDFDGEWASALESDLPWVESHNFVSRGYPNYMRVGESYRMPDFDVTVIRVKNKRKARKKPLFSKRR